MTFGSLFAGIGGFDLGFERAGMSCAWQVEKDDACNRVLAHHWPDVSRYTDVREFPTGDVVRPRVICGGFPCQDLSVAGQRAGLAGKRSGLWHEFARIIEQLAPEWVCIENVPGLLSSNDGRDMGAIVGTLGNLGYGFAYRVLNAQWFGVPQRRRRVFIVGCLGDCRRAAEVLFERESLPWDSPPCSATRARVAAGLTRGPGVSSNAPGRRREDDVNIVALRDERGRCGDGLTSDQAHTLHSAKGMSEQQVVAYQCHGSNVGPIGAVRAGNGNETGGVPFVNCLDRHMGSGGVDDNAAQAGHLVAHALTAEGHDAREDGTGRGTPLVPLDMRQLSRGDKFTNNRTDGGPPGTGIGEAGNPSPAIGLSHPPAVSGKTVRRLTPRECERLHGFPDDHTLVDGTSDSARYRQCGNAVAVPVAQWIGERLMESAR